MKTYDKNHLPVDITEMALHRKTALTPMVMVDGPFTVITQEGSYDLPDGWRGFVAVDKAGYPYPIALAEYHETYEPVGTMRVPLR
ncbi:MAG: hypothetical protein ACREF4_13680 [Gammaproteobacteria bacterium]